jgi:hypothetical protein
VVLADASRWFDHPLCALRSLMSHSPRSTTRYEAGYVPDSHVGVDFCCWATGGLRAPSQAAAWNVVLPPAALLALAAVWGRDLPELMVALIVTLVVSGGPVRASLARDTVFAAAMITCNGILGLSLLVTARRQHVAVFNAEGTGAALATVATLATLTLVLLTFTTSEPGRESWSAQLAFAAVASLLLYASFLAPQTVRHRDFFLPVRQGAVPSQDEHAKPPAARAAVIS